MKLIGLDASPNGTGICVMELADDYSVASVRLYAFTFTQKYNRDTPKVKIISLPKKYERAVMPMKQDLVYPTVTELITGATAAAIEGYAYGEKSSSIFQIAEMAGGLKRLLWEAKIPFAAYPPNVVKRFATGRGGSDKLIMCASFQHSHPNLYPTAEFADLAQFKSPHADMCDAFWMAEVLRNHMIYGKFGRDEAIKKLGETNISFLEFHSDDSDCIIETPINLKP